MRMGLLVFVVSLIVFVAVHLLFLWLAWVFVSIVDFVGFVFLRGGFASGGFLISTPFRF